MQTPHEYFMGFFYLTKALRGHYNNGILERGIMKKKTTLQVRCSYHMKNFGFDLFMGTKDGKGVEGITDGICPACADIEYKKLETERKKQ
jgi:hypothetical protein